MTCFPTLNRKLAVLLARQSLCNGSACSPSPASSHAKSPDAVMKQRSARADSMQTIKRCVRAILYSPKPISLHEDEYRRLLMSSLMRGDGFKSVNFLPLKTVMNPLSINIPVKEKKILCANNN